MLFCRSFLFPKFEQMKILQSEIKTFMNEKLLFYYSKGLRTNVRKKNNLGHVSQNTNLFLCIVYWNTDCVDLKHYEVFFMI